MDDILKDLGLADLVDVFTVNAITPAVVLSLTEEEFKSLGVTAIGDKVRLRERCRDVTSSDIPEESPVLKKLRSLQNRRKGKAKRPLDSNNRKPKETRRLSIGWKHFQNNRFRLITANKGGGKHDVDIIKSATLQETTDLIANQYFPNGENLTSSLSLNQCEYHLATFTGTQVEERMQSGNLFTLGGFVDELRSSPIRLYLHTKEKVEISASGGVTDDLPDLSDEEVLTDTPTITFRIRRRNRLRLRRSSGEAPPTPTSANSTVTSSAAMETTTVEQTSAPSLSEEVHVEVIPDDTEDNDVQIAIEQSLELSKMDLSKQGILSSWMKNTLLSGEPNELLIHRGKILESTIRLVTRPTFNYCSPFKVTFSGETGDDLGGPRREYLSHLMIEVQDNILEGESSNKVFKHEIEKIANGRYELLGRLLAFSVLHGGPGLPVLNPSLYSLMVGNDIDIPVDIEQCVYDYDTRSRLLKIRQAATQEDYLQVLLAESEWLLDHGITSNICNKQIQGKEELIKLLVKNDMYYRVHIEIKQFISGMNSIGQFFEWVLKAPECLQDLFVSDSSILTFPQIRNIYTINFSPEGSNYRQQEQDVVYCFEAFLADCEGGASGIPLKEVLSFWTGASSIPPLGFDKKLEVSFVQSEEPRLPTAHTCGMVLELWRGYANPDVFCSDMKKAISWSGGFHLA